MGAGNPLCAFLNVLGDDELNESGNESGFGTCAYFGADYYLSVLQ